MNFALNENPFPILQRCETVGLIKLDWCLLGHWLSYTKLFSPPALLPFTGPLLSFVAAACLQIVMVTTWVPTSLALANLSPVFLKSVPEGSLNCMAKRCVRLLFSLWNMIRLLCSILINVQISVYEVT